MNEIPVYVTRKTGDGRVGAVTVGSVFVTVALTLVQFNVLLWGCYGLYTVARLFLGA